MSSPYRISEEKPLEKKAFRFFRWLWQSICSHEMVLPFQENGEYYFVCVNCRHVDKAQ